MRKIATENLSSSTPFTSLDACTRSDRHRETLLRGVRRTSQEDFSSFSREAQLKMHSFGAALCDAALVLLMRSQDAKVWRL